MNGRTWTEAELAIVRELYPHRPTHEIATKLGRTVPMVYNQAHNLGLKKTKEFMQSPLSGILTKGNTRHEGVAFQFKKGQTPPNKGVKMPGWAPGRMRETQFKKGQRTGKAAINWRPIGTILTDTDGYLRIKVRDAVHGKEATGFGNTKVWPLYARHVWEQHKGPIPPKHKVIFLDKDRSNCAIENLDCISSGELCRRNSLWAVYPRELAEAIQLTGALKRKIKQREGKNAKEQNIGSA